MEWLQRNRGYVGIGKILMLLIWGTIGRKKRDISPLSFITDDFTNLYSNLQIFYFLHNLDTF